MCVRVHVCSHVYVRVHVKARDREVNPRACAWVCVPSSVHARVHEIGHRRGVETRKSSTGFSGRLELGAALVGRIPCVAELPEVLSGPKWQLRETHGSDPVGTEFP